MLDKSVRLAPFPLDGAIGGRGQGGEEGSIYLPLGQRGTQVAGTATCVYHCS